MAGGRSYNFLLCALVIETVIRATPAHAREAEHKQPKRFETPVCKDNEVLDGKDKCCHKNLIDLEEGELVCFKEPTDESFAVSVTLIGSFTFLISMQFFTQSPDEQMKMYAWKVVSTTISIFIAVMMFQSFDGLVEYFIMGRRLGDLWFEFRVDLCHMVFWYIITQIVLAIASGALRHEQTRKDVLDPSKQTKDRMRMEKDRVSMNCMGYGIVCAHLTGFASINTWTGLQRCAPFDSSPWTAFLPAILCLIFQTTLQKMTDCLRRLYDSRKDWFEAKWDLQCRIAEDDVLGLTLSVVTVNCIRMAINGMSPAGIGCLPDQAQEEVGDKCLDFMSNHKRSLTQILLLLLCGIMFNLSLFFVKLAQEKFFPGGEEEEEVEEAAELLKDAEVKHEKDFLLISDRLSELLVIMLGMSFSWCTFHFNRQLLVYLDAHFLGNQRATLAVVLSMEVTYVAFALISGLNFLAELPDEYTPPAVDRSIIAVIQAMGVWVGFAWESAFDDAVDHIAELARRQGGRSGPTIARFLLGAVVSTFIFVAWKKFQIPFIVKGGWKFGYVFSGPELRQALVRLDQMEPDMEVMKSWGGLVSQFTFEQGDFRAVPGDGIKKLHQKNKAAIRKIQEFREMKLMIESMSGNVQDMGKSMKALEQNVARVDRERREQMY